MVVSEDETNFIKTLALWEQMLAHRQYAFPHLFPALLKPLLQHFDLHSLDALTYFIKAQHYDLLCALHDEHGGADGKHGPYDSGEQAAASQPAHHRQTGHARAPDPPCLGMYVQGEAKDGGVDELQQRATLPCKKQRVDADLDVIRAYLHSVEDMLTVLSPDVLMQSSAFCHWFAQNRSQFGQVHVSTYGLFNNGQMVDAKALGALLGVMLAHLGPVAHLPSVALDKDKKPNPF